MPNKGLYIGRFQPFHLGHLSIITDAFKEVEFLTIGIGSSQYSNEKDNPFTFNERKEMIQEVLKEENIPEDNYQILAIPDIHNNEAWPGHVRSIVGDFDILYLGNKDIIKELFEKYDKVSMKFIDHTIAISSTEIRHAIKKDKNWKKNLHPKVVMFLEDIEGIWRIKGI